VNRPMALDAYACEGGYTRGLQRAGWHVTAVDTDKNRLARNPAEVKVLADAVEYIGNEGHLFGYGHGSPPCQKDTQGNAANDTSDYPDLIAPTRDAFLTAGIPYTIENVTGARHKLTSPILLCGAMFGLTAVDDDGTVLHLQRHRYIESNVLLMVPEHHHPAGVQWAGVYGGGRSDKADARNVRHGGYTPSSRAVQEALLGLTGAGMTLQGLKECLPPAYGEFIGAQLLAHVGVAAA
jgi:DNA (cytosine-5)-methyltransferase 1